MVEKLLHFFEDFIGLADPAVFADVFGSKADLFRLEYLQHVVKIVLKDGLQGSAAALHGLVFVPEGLF